MALAARRAGFPSLVISFYSCHHILCYSDYIVESMSTRLPLFVWSGKGGGKNSREAYRRWQWQEAMARSPDPENLDLIARLT